MDKLRVIQWATGSVGKLSLRAILDDPRLELAGVYAYSAEKVGLDAGTLCGRPEVGVAATNDLDALLALGADTVIFTAFTADLDQIVRMLESGLDVISTNLFLNLGGIRGEVREALEAACRRGGSSLYITGVNPGWINSVATALTAVCRDVQCVTISESAPCAEYESVETWLAMGMSLPEATPQVIENARNWLILFRDSVERVAAALGLAIEELDFSIDYATASERIDLGWFVMEKGTNAAVRAGWDAKIGGKVVVRNRIAWYLTTKLNEGWEFDNEHYHITIEGEPDVTAKIHFLPPEHLGKDAWGNSTTTAMPAVNAVFDVKAARPGILGLKDVGLPSTPAGAWLAERTRQT